MLERFILSGVPAAEWNNTDQHEQNDDGVDSILMTKTGNNKPFTMISNNL
jgi:hypothetical protein